MRALAYLLAFPALLSAHELELAVRHPTPGIVSVLAVYGQETPAKGTAIQVYPPDDEDNAFQSGVTDRNGLFVFAPDKPGEWFVAVDDNLGHRATSTVSMDAQLAPPPPVEPDTPGRDLDILTGVSLLVGLFGVLMWWTGRRKADEARSA